MYEKTNLMNTADKDLLCEFLYMSMGRVLNKTSTPWDKPVPQGVSVFMAYPETGKFVYLYTKDDKYPVRLDFRDQVDASLKRYGSIENGGIVMYLNSCMIPIASKHKRYAY